MPVAFRPQQDIRSQHRLMDKDVYSIWSEIFGRIPRWLKEGVGHCPRPDSGDPTKEQPNYLGSLTVGVGHWRGSFEDATLSQAEEGDETPGPSTAFMVHMLYGDCSRIWHETPIFVLH